MTPAKRPRTASRDGYSALILHHDGTVTAWSVHRQRWERGVPSDEDLATMDARERSRVERHIGSRSWGGV